MAKAVKKPRKKAVNGYKMPDPLPEDEIFTDTTKKQWRLGTSIGKGGFGEIYSAQEASKASSKYPYVIKVEPHGNGPLFVEMHFYMRNAKLTDIEAFMKKHKLKTFGMPAYLGSGSHEYKGTKYRFVVMEKFGMDIDKLRTKNKGGLPESTVFLLAWQLTYILEYIHDQGYVHADIKGGNVILGTTSTTKNQAYLVDFGLANKFTTDEKFKPNPKKVHDGTIEYLSRDAHYGVFTTRGDFEILGYNIIHWLGGTLPWESQLSDPDAVQRMKEHSMKDIPKFVKMCLKRNEDTVVNFFQFISTIAFNKRPDYKKIRTLFEQGVKKNGGSISGSFDILSDRKRRSSSDLDVQEKSVENDITKVKTTSRKKKKKQKENEDLYKSEEVMTDAMKEILAKKQENETKKKVTNTKEKVNEEDFNGYTAEMIEMKLKILNNEKNVKNGPKKKDEQEKRPRRNVPVLNYDERLPKGGKKI